MTRDELKKLKEDLEKRIQEIDLELARIASENPAVKGDFNVRIEDIGSSQEDAAQEAVELDRNQALVDSLERERKEISNALLKINNNDYGKCEDCSNNINPARLKALPSTSLCILCASKQIIR